MKTKNSSKKAFKPRTQLTAFAKDHKVCDTRLNNACKRLNLEKAKVTNAFDTFFLLFVFLFFFLQSCIYIFLISSFSTVSSRTMTKPSRSWPRSWVQRTSPSPMKAWRILRKFGRIYVPSYLTRKKKCRHSLRRVDTPRPSRVLCQFYK